MRFRNRLMLVGVLTVTLWHSSANAEQRIDSTSSKTVEKVIEDYCTFTSDLAAERRYLRQREALKTLDAKVSKRIDELDTRRQELESLIKRQGELRDLARKEMIDIYSGMEAEAAAAQIEKLDSGLGASVLRQLKPRQASAILGVMKPDLAADMMKLIAEAAFGQKKAP